MRIIGLAALLLATASSALAQPLPDLPKTREGNYALGQRFANCSARMQMFAFVAGRAGFPDTVTLAEGKARGWKVAGMIFLAEGMDPSRVTETEQTFDTLVEVKLMDLKARYEVNPPEFTKAVPVEFARECEPLAPMQEALIEVMRRGPTQ